MWSKKKEKAYRHWFKYCEGSQAETYGYMRGMELLLGEEKAYKWMTAFVDRAHGDGHAA